MSADGDDEPRLERERDEALAEVKRLRALVAATKEEEDGARLDALNECQSKQKAWDQIEALEKERDAFRDEGDVLKRHLDTQEEFTKVAEQQVGALRGALKQIATLLTPEGPRRALPLPNIDKALEVAIQAEMHRTAAQPEGDRTKVVEQQIRELRDALNHASRCDEFVRATKVWRDGQLYSGCDGCRQALESLAANDSKSHRTHETHNLLQMDSEGRVKTVCEKCGGKGASVEKKVTEQPVDEALNLLKEWSKVECKCGGVLPCIHERTGQFVRERASHRTHDLRKPLLVCDKCGYSGPISHPHPRGVAEGMCAYAAGPAPEPKCTCQEKDRNVPICPLHPFTIHLNGREKHVGLRLSYEDAVRISEIFGADLYTVAYTIIGENRGGMLTPGQSVKVEAGMSVDVCFTGNA